MDFFWNKINAPMHGYLSHVMVELVSRGTLGLNG